MKKQLKFLMLAATILVLSAVSAGAFAQDNSKGEWIAPAEADHLTNPFAGNSEAVKAGKKIYKQQCAICHGDTGKGDGVAGMTLTPRPASFRSDKVKNESDGAIFWKITNGRSPMAAYKDLLSEEQRWQLVSYIRVLSK